MSPPLELDEVDIRPALGVHCDQVAVLLCETLQIRGNARVFWNGTWVTVTQALLKQGTAVVSQHLHDMGWRLLSVVLGEDWRACRRTFYVPRGTFVRSAEVVERPEGLTLRVVVDWPPSDPRRSDWRPLESMPVYVDAGVHEDRVPKVVVGTSIVGADVADIRVPMQFVRGWS